MITTNVDARLFNEMQNDHLTAEEKLVFLTIMLSPARSLIGIHKVNVDMLKVLTSLTKPKVRTALAKLKEKGLIIGDLDKGEVYMPFFLKSNPLKGGKTYKVYFEDLQRVRNMDLIDYILADSTLVIPATFAAALIDTGYEKLLETRDIKFSVEELNSARKAYVKAKEDK